MPSRPTEIHRLLERARSLGFLGPMPVEAHIRHARGFLAAMGQGPVQSLLDLGSGGGVPGLVLAGLMPDTTFLLLDANLRKTDFLVEAVRILGFESRVRVLRERAELVGRQSEWREHFQVVVARSFGPPGPTAECGSPLVMVGGAIIVSEPPSDHPPGSAMADGFIGTTRQDRWPVEGLRQLGLVPRGQVMGEGFSFQILDKVGGIGERHPRRAGLPGQRPLF